MAVKYIGNFWLRGQRPIIDGIPLPEGYLYRNSFQSIKMIQVGTGTIKYAQFRTLGIHPDGSIRYLGIGTEPFNASGESEWVVETSDIPLPADTFGNPSYATTVYICQPEVTGENDVVYRWEPSVIRQIWRGPYFFEWEAWGWFLNPADSMDKLIWGRMYVVQYKNPAGLAEIYFQFSNMQPRSQFADLTPMTSNDFASNSDKIKRGSVFFKDMVVKPRSIPGGNGMLYYANINQWMILYDSYSFPDPDDFQDGLGPGEHYWNHPSWVGPYIRPTKEYAFNSPENPWLNWPQNILWQPNFRNTPSSFTGPVGGWPDDASVPDVDLGNAYIRTGSGAIIKHFRYQPSAYHKDTPMLQDAESIVVRFVAAAPNSAWEPKGTWDFWSSNWWKRTPLRPVDPETQCMGYWEGNEIAPVAENPGWRGTYHPFDSGGGDDDRNYTATRRYVSFTTVHPRTGEIENRNEFTYPQRRYNCRYEEYLYTHQAGYGRMRSKFTMPDIDQLYNQGTLNQQDQSFDTMIMIGLTEVERPVQHNYVSPWNYTKLVYWKRRPEFGDSFGEGNAPLEGSNPGIDAQAIDYHEFNLGESGSHSIKEEWADGTGRSSKLFTGIDMEHITCPEIQTFIRTGIYWFAERTCHKMECLQDSETAFGGGKPIWSQRTLAYGLLAAKNAYYSAWYYRYVVNAGVEFINTPYSYHRLACDLWNRVLGDAGYINIKNGNTWMLAPAQVPIRPPTTPAEVPPQQGVHWLHGPVDARVIFGMSHGGDWSGCAPWMDAQALGAAITIIMNENRHLASGGGTSFPSRPDWYASSIEVLRHHFEYMERVCHLEPGVPALSYHDPSLRQAQGFGTVQDGPNPNVDYRTVGKQNTPGVVWFPPDFPQQDVKNTWGGFWYKLGVYLNWTGRAGDLSVETAWYDPWAYFFPPNDNGYIDNRIPSYGSSTSWSPLGLGPALYWPEFRTQCLEPGDLVTWATNCCVRTFPQKDDPPNAALDFWYAPAKQWVINGGAPAECLDAGGSSASQGDEGGDGWPEKEEWPVTPDHIKVGQYWPDPFIVERIQLPYSGEPEEN